MVRVNGVSRLGTDTDTRLQFPGSSCTQLGATPLDEFGSWIYYKLSDHALGYAKSYLNGSTREQHNIANI